MAKDVNTDDRQGAIPANLIVVKRQEDLPRYESIISGMDKLALIHVPEQFIEQVVVLLSKKLAVAVADISLFATTESAEIFKDIRSQAEANNIDPLKIVWATRAIVSELLKIRPSTKNTEKIGVANAQTESAQRFREWVEYALEEKASDIHVEVRRDMASLRFRIDGELEDMRGESGGQYISSLAQNTVAYVYNKMTDSKSTSGSQFQPNKHMYSMVSYGEGDQAIKLRCQTISLVNGFDLVARVLRTEEKGKVLSYLDLGYTESQAKLIEDATITTHGLVLIAGVTGSGKTTTLKSMMQSMPGRARMKLVSIEDPVEYIIEGVSQTALQRDVSDEEDSTKIFNEAVKSWMRGDPDVMMMGEIRDGPSGTASLTQAETGHMALGTVHANGAAGIVQRLVSPAIGMDLHALTAPNILSLLVYQALVPLLCEHCKVPIDLMPPAVITSFRAVAVKFNADVWSMCFKKDGGCKQCKFRGTRGMTVVAEIIKPDRKFLSLLRERREFDAIDHWLSHSDGFYDTNDMRGKTVFQHAFYLAIQGKIDAYAPERFEKYENVEMHVREEKKSNKGRG